MTLRDPAARPCTDPARPCADPVVILRETLPGSRKGGLTRGNGLQGSPDPASTLRTLSTLLTLSLRGAP